MKTTRLSSCALSLFCLILALSHPLKSETVWSENFADGNFSANPAWNVPWGQVSVVPFVGNQCLDVHATPMSFSGRIYVELPDVGYGGQDEFRLEFDLHPRETMTDHNNVRMQIYNWETYDFFELMENDNSNLQLRVNGQTIAQVPLNGFPQRWHHVVMQTSATGYWTIIWDQGGSNQTTIEGQGPWGGPTLTLVPILQLQCDGYYNSVNGAYFDNMEMWSDGNLVWHDNFADGNYTANPAWNIPSGEVSVAMLEGNYVLDNHALPNWTSGRIYVELPDVGFGGTDEFTLTYDLRPRETLSSANNVRVQIWNWETYDNFELMENDNDNIQLRSNGVTVAQMPINGFPDRWHHTVMQRNGTGWWTVTWDQGGSNQTTIQGQDVWSLPTSTLVPVLQIQCDGNYSTVNGAYFDNLVMSTPPYVYPGEFMVDDHTAALWHFNENTGRIAHDATFNHYDMALQDGAGWQAPGWNNTPSAVDLTDPDAKVSSDYSIGNGWDAITIDAEIYATQINNQHPIVSRTDFWNIDAVSYYFEVRQNGVIAGGVWCNEVGTQSADAVSAPGVIQVGQWYHVALTWSSGQPARIFVNDMTSPVVASAESPTGYVRTSDDPLMIGANWYQIYGWFYWQGYIDEVRISDVDRYPVIQSNPQIPPTLWTHAYGGAQDDYLYCVQQTEPDHGFIAVGTKTEPSLGTQIWVTKTDQNGAIQWQHTWGGAYNDAGRWVEQTEDGGYIVSGNYYVDSYNCDAVLLKYDASGNLIWWQHYNPGGIEGDAGECVQPTGDGGYILAGGSFNWGTIWDFWLAKVSSTGNLEWQHIYPMGGYQSANFVRQTSEGGYIMSGYTTPFYPQPWNAYVIKTNGNGVTQWTNQLGGSGGEYACCVRQVNDGYIATGFTDSYGAGGTDGLIYKLNNSGTQVWRKTYGGSGDDEFRKFQILPDGNYAIAGTYATLSQSSDYWLMVTNAEGDSLDSHTYGGPGAENGSSLSLTDDGGYILSGWTQSYGSGGWDGWLVRLGTAGPPAPPIDITLTPINPPLIIPPGGGSFSFNLSMENVSTSTQNFDLWNTIQVPGGSQFTVLGPLVVNLDPGASIVRLRTQAVPANAPAGQYCYRGFVGDHPWSVTDADSFAFSKQGDAGDWQGPDGWYSSGELFPGEKAVSSQPATFALLPCYPNPFNPSTVVRYQMPEARNVSLKVFDIGGRLVATLVDGMGDAGTHEVTFDGSKLASGIYLARLQAGELTAIQKMVLIK